MNLALATPAFTARPAMDWLRAFSQSMAPAPKLATRQRQTVHVIEKTALVEIAHPYGATIDCLTGSVWVTLDNDMRDVVLSSGQRFRVDSNQRVLVQALDVARVRINELA